MDPRPTGESMADLQAREREYDAMVEQMQCPEQRRAVDQFFGMTGTELGETAVRGTTNER